MKCNKCKIFVDEKNIKRYKKFHNDLEYIKRNVYFDEYDINVFEFHHGLKDANKKILNYIKEKTFIDVGSYHKDSIYILQYNTTNPIYSYDITDKNIEKLNYYINKNGELK